MSNSQGINESKTIESIPITGESVEEDMSHGMPIVPKCRPLITLKVKPNEGTPIVYLLRPLKINR